MWDIIFFLLLPWSVQAAPKPM